jgi:hypothetical protein
VRLGRSAIALASLAVTLGVAAPAQGAELVCPSTFHVLHDDRIGALQLPQGHYTITVLDDTQLSCAHASDLFRQFLEDWDGRLPRPWVLDAATATFTRGSGSTNGFRVSASATPSGGGGGGHHPAQGTACPAFFTVLHNDHIGKLSLRAGEYRITLLAVGRLTCARAAKLFARFLQDFDGRLPRPWVLDPATGTFLRGSAHVGFRVKSAAGEPVVPDDAGTHPSDGTRCPGTFRVLHNDRIGKLRLAAGQYRITRLRGSKLSCSGASSLFRQFLQDTDGQLEPPWQLNTRTATFSRGGGDGFRVKPARPL